MEYFFDEDLSHSEQAKQLEKIKNLLGYFILVFGIICLNGITAKLKKVIDLKKKIIQEIE